MANVNKSPLLTRLTGILGFFIGIFGCMAILGVFFKILKLPHYETFMMIGFIGEAAAFVIMGLFSLIGSFSTRKYQDLDVSTQAVAVPVARPDVEIRASFQKMLEQHVSDEVNQMMAALSEEIRRFGAEIQHVGGELERARTSVYNMRKELDRVASGDLAGDAERLGRGMQVLGSEMGEAGSAVERMRADLEDMAQRFRHFNEPATPERTDSKIKMMPWS